jgi:hypothetical protein
MTRSLAKLLAPIALVGATLGLSANPAQALSIFVGSWNVYDGPPWAGSPPDGPPAYTGQEAAALIFGGSPSDYRISTVDSNPLNINDSACYSIIGYGEGIFADDYFSKYLGLYYGPTSGFPESDPSASASAYVNDNSFSTNYAFRDINDVPGPLPVFGAGAAFACSRTLRKRIAKSKALSVAE